MIFKMTPKHMGTGATGNFQRGARFPIVGWVDGLILGLSKSNLGGLQHFLKQELMQFF